MSCMPRWPSTACKSSNKEDRGLTLLSSFHYDECIDSAGPPVNEDFTMAKRVCPNCFNSRDERSFLRQNGTSRKICKPCKYRPDSVRVRTWRARREGFKRMRDAVCYVVKQTQTDKQSFVYLMKVDPDLFKIGFSTDVNKRLRQLTANSSLPVQLIAVAPGGRSLEQDLHRRFESLRLGNEWFLDRSRTIVPGFAELQGAMVFLPGYMKQVAPDVSQVM